ncbi:hypothetical protein BC834DRAFT_975249 [Gloeopeniophorella convolvens]|nr:hypothetical protein BC834DRAFT_975249 [Gloeopeniophorella convolvens]
MSKDGDSGSYQARPRYRFSESATTSVWPHRIVTIGSLPDNVLLEVFDLCRLMNPESGRNWYQVVPAHVCHRWRQIIIASPRRLELLLRWFAGSPITDVLRLSPPSIPVRMWYKDDDEGPRGRDWDSQAEANFLLLLEYLPRVREVSFYSTSPEIIGMLLSKMTEPAPMMDLLYIESGYTCVTIPNTFLGGDAPSLDFLELSGALPTLPLASNTITLIFTMKGYIPELTWLEDLLEAVCSMHRLKHLDLILGDTDFSPLRDKQLKTLQGLTAFELTGTLAQLEAITSRIDAPNLDGLVVKAPVSGVFPLPSFSRFVRSAEVLHLDSAHVGITHDKLLLGSCPPPLCTPYFRITISFQWRDWKEVVRTFSSVFGPLFQHTELLSLGFALERSYSVLCRENRAGYEQWSTLLAEFKFSEVEVLWIDSNVAEGVVTALSLPGPTLLAKATDIHICHKTSDDVDLMSELQKGLECIFQARGARAARVCRTVFLPEDWRWRLHSLFAEYGDDDFSCAEPESPSSSGSFDY